MVDAFIGKKYKLASSDKFDEYMSAVGVGLVTRKMGATVSPVVELNKEGDKYVITSNSTFKNITAKFTPGVQFDDETADGRKVKSTYTVNGATITENQVDSKGVTSIIDRTWSSDEIKMVLKCGDVVCTRIYKAQ